MLKMIKVWAQRVSYKIRDFRILLRALIPEFPSSKCFPVRSQFPRVVSGLAVKNPLFLCFVVLGQEERRSPDIQYFHFPPSQVRRVPPSNPSQTLISTPGSGNPIWRRYKYLRGFHVRKGSEFQGCGIPVEKALGSPSQRYCHPLEALPCRADGILLVFSDAFYKPQSCQPKLSWKHVALCASSSKNAAPFEELFLKIRIGETPQGLCREAQAT